MVEILQRYSYYNLHGILHITAVFYRSFRLPFVFLKYLRKVICTFIELLRSLRYLSNSLNCNKIRCLPFINSFNSLPATFYVPAMCLMQTLEICWILKKILQLTVLFLFSFLDKQSAHSWSWCRRRLWAYSW